MDAGVAFSFAGSAITTLAAGGRVVVAENASDFVFRYGPGLLLAGVFTGNLSHGGETLRVVDGTRANIALVTYHDAAPWPSLPDGDGPSLVLRAPNLDPALPGSWRSSYVNGGKPGQIDTFTIMDWRAQHFSAADLADPAKEATVWGELANPDGDWASNLLEYALGGTVSNDAASVPGFQSQFFTEAGQTWLRGIFTVREGVAGVTVRAEVSSELSPGAWQPLTPLNTIS